MYVPPEAEIQASLLDMVKPVEIKSVFQLLLSAALKSGNKASAPEPISLAESIIIQLPVVSVLLTIKNLGLNPVVIVIGEFEPL